MSDDWAGRIYEHAEWGDFGEPDYWVVVQCVSDRDGVRVWRVLSREERELQPGTAGGWIDA